jgi:hypothetical protein
VKKLDTECLLLVFILVLAKRDIHYIIFLYTEATLHINCKSMNRNPVKHWMPAQETTLSDFAEKISDLSSF